MLVTMIQLFLHAAFVNLLKLIYYSYKILFFVIFWEINFEYN